MEKYRKVLLGDELVPDLYVTGPQWAENVPLRRRTDALGRSQGLPSSGRVQIGDKCAEHALR